MRNASLGQIARHPCCIQRLKTKANDEDEDDQDVWETIGRTRVGFPAQVGGIYANRELVENARMMSRNLQYAEMLYPGFEVTSRMRLITRGATYNIRGVEDIEGRHRRLKLVVIREDDHDSGNAN